MFVFFGLLLAVTDDTMFRYITLFTLGDVLGGLICIVDVDVADRRLIS